MTERIVYEQADGTVAVVTPSERYLERLVAQGRTRREALEMVAAKDVPKECVASCNLVQMTELPSLRFHAAWRLREGRVEVELSTALRLRLAEIRAERDRRLAALDGPWMRAVGQGQTGEAQTIEAARQRLRDLPNDLEGGNVSEWEAIATPEELEAFTPDWTAVKEDTGV